MWDPWLHGNHSNRRRRTGPSRREATQSLRRTAAWWATQRQQSRAAWPPSCQGQHTPVHSIPASFPEALIILQATPRHKSFDSKTSVARQPRTFSRYPWLQFMKNFLSFSKHRSFPFEKAAVFCWFVSSRRGESCSVPISPPRANIAASSAPLKGEANPVRCFWAPQTWLCPAFRPSLAHPFFSVGTGSGLGPSKPRTGCWKAL